MKKEDQGTFVVNVPDDIAPGRPVNYLNVNVTGGQVVLDMGFIGPLYRGMAKPEATIVFRGGTNVEFLRILHATVGGILRQLDTPQPAGAPPPAAPPAAGGQVN